MNISMTTERPEAAKIVAKITVKNSDVDEVIKRTYNDIAHLYAFQGFRRGRAPRPVIDGIIGREAVLAQATEELLRELQPQVLDELDVVPVGKPVFDDGEEPAIVAEGDDYSVELTLDVPPICDLDSYDAPSIEMPSATATESEIDAQIQELLSYHVSYEDIEEDRAVEADDIVMCDIENKEGAAQFAGKNRMLKLDDPSIPEQLKDAIIGMRIGDTKEVEWVRSHTHGDEVLEHTFVLSVTLNAIRKAVLPELTDDFTKKNFGFDTIDELREAVAEEINEDKDRMLPSLKEDRVVEAVGERLILDELPKSYEDQVFNELANDFLAQLQRQGISLDAYLGARQIETNDFLNDLHEQARERARQSLALDAIARHLGLTATDEDVRGEFAKAGVADVAAGIEEFVNDGRISAVREGIRRTKAVAWLTENATVTTANNGDTSPEVEDQASELEESND